MPCRTNRTEPGSAAGCGTCHGLWPLLCALLLTACAGEGRELNLQLDVTRHEGQVHYRLTGPVELPEKLRIALNQGLSLRLNFTARRLEQGHWYRQVEQRWQQAMLLRYSALTRHYQLQHGEGWLTLAEWREVKLELGRQQWHWPQSDPDRRVEVRWWLDDASLPPSLRLQALLDDSLSFDTGWQVLHGG